MALPAKPSDTMMEIIASIAGIIGWVGLPAATNREGVDLVVRSSASAVLQITL